MMRGTPGMRLVLLILSPIFLALCVLAIRGEEQRPWMKYQDEFRKLYVTRARAKAEAAVADGDTQQSARWQKIAQDVARSEPRIEQVYIEELNLADRCVTCHRGIDNPLFEDAPQPFRTHPGTALQRHDVTRFGCTLCHDGQGAALTLAEAHGRDTSAPQTGSAATPHAPGSQTNGMRPLIAREYLQATCLRCHEQTRGLEKAEVVNRGADLFISKGCYGCHGTRDSDSLPKYSPPLLDIGSKLKDPQRWLYAWVKDPTTLNPGTAMPAFKLNEENVGKIVAFLASMPTAGPGEPVALGDVTPQEGERLFNERGCRNCHAVAADDRSVSPRVPHLAGIGSKARPEWLDRWIANPKAYYPDGAMPRLDLKDRERHAIVAYLLTLTRPEGLPPAPDLSRFDAAEGKKLVRQYECFGCHAIPGFERVRPSVPDLAEFAKKPLEDLDFGSTDVPRTKWDWLKRKLGEPRAYESEKIKLLMPTVGLAPDEAQALITYVLGFEEPNVPPRYTVRATDAQHARGGLAWMTTRFNCNACHVLNEQEPRLARLPNRTQTLPPPLDGIATRFPGHTVYQIVLDPKRARPWAGMWMPTFGLNEAQARAFVEGFASVSGVTNPYADVATLTTVGPPLTSLRNKLVDADWLVAWVQKPSHMRPGTAMPDADMPTGDVLAVARYLYQEPAAPAPVPAAWQGGNAEAGEKLFVTRGCRGCHAIERGKPSITSRVPNLAGVGRKDKGEWLYAWVKDPRAYSPRTAMPQLKLKDEEIRDLVAFLLTRKDGADIVEAAPKFDPGRDPAAGRDAIERNGCMRCHEVRGFPVPAPAVALIPDVPAGSTAIALSNGRVLIEHYNCRACHKVDGKGGEIGNFLERKSLVPPIIEGEGARVQPSWLVDFLQEPKNLRPWMQIRMPLFKFPEGEARATAAYFAAAAGLTPVNEPLPAPQPDLIARGLKSFVRLKCGQCHPTNPDQALPADVDPEDLSLNLTLAKTRLRPSWIPKFLARPKKIAGTQTRMPAAFYNTDGIPVVDDPDGMIAAVTAYMLQMTELPPAEAAKPAEKEKPAAEQKDWTNFQY